MPQMAEKTSPDAPPSCAVLPLFSALQDRRKRLIYHKRERRRQHRLHKGERDIEFNQRAQERIDVPVDRAIEIQNRLHRHKRRIHRIHQEIVDR